jgi:general secretion pathway protein D
MISFLATLSLLAPAAPAPAAVQDGGETPVIQDIGNNNYLLTFDESPDGMTLEQFVKICQEITNINFTYSTDTSTMLQNSKVRMFGSKVIPKDDFYSFFQIIMIINKFVCTKIGPEHLSVVVVASLDSPQRATIKQDAVYITPDQIEEYANQPATLVQTVLHVPNMDVRTMGASMRQLVVDPNTMQLIPIPESSSVILTGFGSNVSALTKMLLLIDTVSAPEPPVLPKFEVIKLEYASADELSETLEELLEASRRATTSGNQGQQRQGPTGALQQGTVETKIMVQPRTNSLLVMAMPDDMPAIMELVARLDIDHVQRERNYHFMPLENADAEELADVLTEFLSDSSRIQSTAAGGQNRGTQNTSTSSSNEVAVVPDPATNSLLIAAGRSRFEEVADLIERLDTRQDQVLIETALIELSGREFLDLGVELGGADIPNSDQMGGFGVSSFGLSSFQDTDGDGIPDARVPTLAQGITAGIIEGSGFSLPILIAAIEEQRDTNVLNIPSVLVNNNGNATVRTLDEQPTTTITQNSQGGTQENFNGYEEAGITLQISPTISAARFLNLNISLEVSSFQGAFSGSIPPPRIMRTLTTVVNIPDGDTMVIGGIIVDNKTIEVEKVPLLGDIPLLGILFKRESEIEDRTTLYFFVTPHIMHDREFADLAAFSYRKKLEAAETIGAGRVRIIDPFFGDQEDEKDLLDGFKLPNYQAPDSGEVDQSFLGIDNKEASELLEPATTGGQ